MNDEIMCPECKRQIPSTSEYCTFCGQKIRKSKIVQQHPKRIPIFPLVCGLLCFVLVGESIFFYSVYVKPYGLLREESDAIQKENESLRADLNDQKSAYEEKIKKLNDSLSASGKDESNTKRENTKNMRFIRNYESLMEDLAASTTTNGIISVPSKVYAVKKGDTATIKITWPEKATTAYSYVEKPSIISTDWIDHNVRVTGTQEGVTTLRFSADNAGKEKPFLVTIVCYE